LSKYFLVFFICTDVPSRAGETPYNIDLAHQKPIMGQVFGSRKLNTNEDSENMLGKLSIKEEKKCTIHTTVEHRAGLHM
jgi:hypothetical protein